MIIVRRNLASSTLDFSDVPVLMECSQCSYINGELENSCTSCGAQLSIPAPVTTRTLKPQGSHAEAPPKKTAETDEPTAAGEDPVTAALVGRAPVEQPSLTINAIADLLDAKLKPVVDSVEELKSTLT